MTMPFVTNCLRIWRPSCAITSTRRIAAGRTAGNGRGCFSVAAMRLRYLGRRPRSQSSHGLALGFDRAGGSGQNAADPIRSVQNTDADRTCQNLPGSSWPKRFFPVGIVRRTGTASFGATNQHQTPLRVSGQLGNQAFSLAWANDGTFGPFAANDPGLSLPLRAT